MAKPVSEGSSLQLEMEKAPNFFHKSAGCNIRAIFFFLIIRITIILNSEFYFSLAGCFTKAKESSLPYYLLTTREGDIDSLYLFVFQPSQRMVHK